jgi:SPP1 gp7 family putative phage head morphogenesis protein
VTPVEQELARQRAAQRQQEQARTQHILTLYETVRRRFEHDLNALADEIETATAQGVEVRPGWLFAQARYRALMADLAAHTHDFLQTAAEVTISGQADAVAQAVEDGRRLAERALIGPEHTVARVAGAWNRLPGPALDHLIGQASDGTPLTALFAEVAPAAPEKVRDSLAFGVAAGRNPRVVAREVAKLANVTPNRALTIARTEIVGAHRAGVTATWQQTGAVAGWTWRCARDARTCAVCWALDGSEHAVDAQMESHPCCRCGRIPRMKTWVELGFSGVSSTPLVTTTGPGVFATLSEADKLAVLGRSKLDAYNNGDITLQDLVKPTHSNRWGPGVRVASLAEALA